MFFVVLTLVGLFLFMLKMENQINRNQKEAQMQAEQTVRFRRDFVDQLLPKTQELYEKYGVLPSITLAQAILESNWGKSTLGSKYHNLFGIKAGPTERKVHLETQEFENGVWKTILADFKVYDSFDDSLEDHTKLFIHGTSWNKNQYQRVLEAKDYKEGAKALQESGYATAPNYEEKLIELIEQYELYRYDKPFS